MKIALYNLTTTTKTGGVESFVWELARYLTRLYPDCQIDIIGGKSPPGFQIPEIGPQVRIITRPFVGREQFRRLPLLNRAYGLTKLLERLTFGVTSLRLLGRERYDIVHIQKPYDLPIAQLAQRRYGSQILFGCHGKDFFSGDRFFARNLAAVSCSHYNAATIEQHYGLHPVVVYNGIDIELFSPRPVRPELRARFARPDEFLVTLVGRHERWKGIQHLLYALAKLRRKNLPVKALLVGDGPYRAYLEQLAQKLDVGEAVCFLGNLPNRDLPDYYALSDIVIGTSFGNETFGIALCEAAACERPIIASDFGGFREVVQHGETGLRYPAQNSEALAEAIEELLDDPARRLAFGQAGRRFVAENFTWERVAARVYTEYRQILPD